MESKDPNWTLDGRQFLKPIEPGDRFPSGTNLLTLLPRTAAGGWATVTVEVVGEPAVRGEVLFFQTPGHAFHRYPLEFLVSWHEHRVTSSSPWFRKPEPGPAVEQTVSLGRDGDKVWVTSDVDFTPEQRKNLLRWNAVPATLPVDDARCWTVSISTADHVASGLVLEALESYFKGQGATVLKESKREPLFPNQSCSPAPLQKVTVRTFIIPQTPGTSGHTDLILVSSTMDFTPAQRVFMTGLGLKWLHQPVRTTGWVPVANLSWVLRRMQEAFPGASVEVVCGEP